MEEQQNKLKESLATKRNRLYNSFKGVIKTYNEPANFKEPILILMRRGKKTEFYENATGGVFLYKHTDGEERTIILHPSNIRTFPNGKRTFEGYICHEDFPLPLPEDPVITAETVGIAVEKTMHDVKKWKSTELTAKGKMIQKIAIGIAIIIIAVAAYKMFVPQQPQQVVQVVKETAKAATAVTVM